MENPNDVTVPVTDKIERNWTVFISSWNLARRRNAQRSQFTINENWIKTSIPNILAAPVWQQLELFS